MTREQLENALKGQRTNRATIINTMKDRIARAEQSKYPTSSFDSLAHNLASDCIQLQRKNTEIEFLELSAELLLNDTENQK